MIWTHLRSFVLGVSLALAVPWAWAQINISQAGSTAVSSISAGAITAATFGADAINAAAVANSTIDAATYAAGAIDATAIAASAIGASEIATGAIDADAIAAQAFAGQLIRSIQQGTITIAGSTSSNTATITSVNTARSFVIYQGGALGTNDSQDEARVTLTNATTVTMTRGAALSAGSTYGYVVVELM